MSFARKQNILAAEKALHIQVNLSSCTTIVFTELSGVVGKLFRKACLPAL